jgi:hypothetical protein
MPKQKSNDGIWMIWEWINEHFPVIPFLHNGDIFRGGFNS